MKQKAWKCKPEGSRFAVLPFIKKNKNCPNFLKTPKSQCSHFSSTPEDRSSPSSSSSSSSNFSALPDDLLTRIAASFSLPNLRAASLVCRTWSDALKPLREAMTFLMWGKRFKHGRGGVKPNLNKALDSFLKGASCGSALAMVDAGLIYWELGKKAEAYFWYRRAAELGNAAGQCNLAISYLQAIPPNNEEAVQWLYKASVSGHVRAQYQLALCLHHGRGVKQSPQEAARWYLKAAEGGYSRAMYNTSLCYAMGEGMKQSHKLAREWRKRAADCGHSQAQFRHGLSLISEGEMVKAVVYLELATRSGERAASPVRNVILEQLSESSRNRAMRLVEDWHALPSSG